MVLFALACTLRADTDIRAFLAAQERTRASVARAIASTVGIINPSVDGKGITSEGSGVVITEGGLILTVAHVLGQPGSELTVIFSDGRRATAKALGVDFTRDAGMVQITDPGKWSFAELAPAGTVRPGQWCMAVGHPGGVQSQRTPPVRLGRVLAIQRGESGFNGLLSDATIISGDSGGPLLDLDGRVIGIHSNIGLNVTENRHVAADLYRSRWNDLVSSRQIGTRPQPGPTLEPSHPLVDMRRFKILLAARLQAGDKEARDMARARSVDLTPQEMNALMDRWEREAGAPHASERPKGTIEASRQTRTSDSPFTRPLISSLSTPTNVGVPLLFEGNSEVSKASPRILAQVAPITAAAGQSIVTVVIYHRKTALGTVIRADGYIVTKASEAADNVICVLGDREMPARLVAKNSDYDLALLKVEARDLVPVKWAAETAVPLGSWLVTPEVGGRPIGVGILGVSARAIAETPTLALRNRAALGVKIPYGNSAAVDDVAEGGPAWQAGVKPGDVVLSIDDTAIADSTDVIHTIGKYAPGDKVRVLLRRGGESLSLTVTLAHSDVVAPQIGDASAQRLERLSEAGGMISTRRSRFPVAFTHDTVVQAMQCGGPVLDLEGRAVGINIARADRTSTLAIPFAALRPVVTEMLKAR